MGINDSNQLLSVSVYPIPATNTLTAQFSKTLTKASIVLLDLAGKRVFEKQENNTSMMVLDIKGLAPGIYTLQLSSNQGNLSKKIVIQN